MSAKQRVDGEALREKYCRVLGVEKENVFVDFQEDGDVLVYHAGPLGGGFPVWSYAVAQAPSVTPKETK